MFSPQIDLATTAGPQLFAVELAVRSFRQAISWPSLRLGWAANRIIQWATALAIALENQFKPEEFGPTRIDERHRIVASGLFDFPHGFQLAPIVQFATARPYSPIAGIDIDGDGRVTVIEFVMA